MILEYTDKSPYNKVSLKQISPYTEIFNQNAKLGL